MFDALFAAFQGASVFNSDLSKWETGNVTTMAYSKCTLLGVVFFFQTIIDDSHFLLFFGGLVVFFVCGVFCVVLFKCCDALLAAFYKAYAFNSDLSKWETGKVTDMAASKCIQLCTCTLLGVVLFSKQEKATHTSFVFLGTCCVFCLWGVAVLFECCDALLAAFRNAVAFNSDLSKWQTGKVTTMYRSKCTLLGVVFFFQTRI